MKELTSMQAMALRYLHSFYLQNDQLPPMQVVAKHFGWASINNAELKCKALTGKGYLEKNAVNKHKFTAKAREFFLQAK